MDGVAKQFHLFGGRQVRGITVAATIVGREYTLSDESLMQRRHVPEIVRNDKHAHDHAQRIEQRRLNRSLARYRIALARYPDFALNKKQEIIFYIIL